MCKLKSCTKTGGLETPTDTVGAFSWASVHLVSFQPVLTFLWNSMIHLNRLIKDIFIDSWLNHFFRVKYIWIFSRIKALLYLQIPIAKFSSGWWDELRHTDEVRCYRLKDSQGHLPVLKKFWSFRFFSGSPGGYCSFLPVWFPCFQPIISRQSQPSGDDRQDQSRTPPASVCTVERDYS